MVSSTARDSAQRPRGIPTARAIDHVAFTVPDLEQGIEFFRDVLGCELVYRAGPFADPDGDWMATNLGVHPSASLHLALLRAGRTLNVELFEYEAPDQLASMPVNSDVGGHHIAFYVDDIDRAVAYLQGIDGVRVMGDPTPVGPPQPNAGARFVYFKAPWGLQMELISFPDGLAYEAGATVRAVAPAAAWNDDTGECEMRSKGMVIGKGTRTIAFDDVEFPEPGPEDAVVAARYVGICRSDLELLDGDFDEWVEVDYPIVIGHEWSGEVVSVGADVEHLVPGDRVVGECVAGHERWFGLTFNGAGAEQFVVPARLLHRIPDGIAFKQASMVEPFTIAYRALQLAAPVDGGDVVAVIGGGMIGQCAQVVARANGATTVLIEPSASRRGLATRMGADVTIDPTAVDDLTDALREHAGVDGADAVIEASGNARGIAATFEVVRHGGRIVNVGVCPDREISAPLSQIQAKDLTIRGMTGSPGVWPRALRFIARHGIDLEPLASHDLAFAEIAEAVEVARDPTKSLKVLLHP